MAAPHWLALGSSTDAMLATPRFLQSSINSSVQASSGISTNSNPSWSNQTLFTVSALPPDKPLNFTMPSVLASSSAERAPRICSVFQASCRSSRNTPMFWPSEQDAWKIDASTRLAACSSFNALAASRPPTATIKLSSLSPDRQRAAFRVKSRGSRLAQALEMKAAGSPATGFQRKLSQIGGNDAFARGT